MQKAGSVFLFLLCFTAVSTASGALRRIKDSTDKNVSQLISSNGYPVQEYTVTTEDSYVITIQRIPGGRGERRRRRRRRKPVAFLMTGLECSSAEFVVNLPHQSLGFILADHGFDVWLGNVRGTQYSRHRRLKKWMTKFWNFSFDEMAKYDLPAQIDFILRETKRRALEYVGWSQGTLIMFALLAEQPSYNRKVRLFNAMAPVAYLGHMTSDIKLLIPVSKMLADLAQSAFRGAFLAKNSPVLKILRKKACGSVKQGPVCKSAFKLFNGGFPIEMNMTRFPLYMANSPSGSSVRNMYHYAELIRDDRFQKFDWGRRKNMKVYGQKRPPQYDLSKVTAPVALYWSDGDVLVTPRDVAHLERSLPNVVLSYKVPVHGFTHIDFAWSTRAWKHVYRKILEMMTTYSRT
ncbi:gastric triacylglycerol lipase-like [Amblyomma americanum]